MTDQKQKAFALLNAWTTCDTTLIADLLDPAFTEIDRPQPDAKGADGLGTKLQQFHRAHTDVTLRVVRQIEAGPMVCTEWLIYAMARDPGDAVPKPVRIAGISWARFDNGRIVKHRIYRDIVGYLMQRGYRWSGGPAGKTAPKERAA